jgi:hypothetical protein
VSLITKTKLGLSAVPDPPEVKYLNLGMEEVRKELVGMKNREGINNYVCVIVVSINLVFVFLCTLLEHERNTQAKTILSERHTIGSLML